MTLDQDEESPSSVLVDQISHLEDLINSPGWAMVRQAIQEKLLGGANQLASPTTNPAPENIHFKRGALWALKDLANLPEEIVRSKRDTLAFRQAEPID